MFPKRKASPAGVWGIFAHPLCQGLWSDGIFGVVDAPAHPPGFGLSLIALIACRVITSVITFALAPVLLGGVTADQAVRPDTLLAHAAAFVLLALTVNTVLAAWVLRMLVKLLGAHVTFTRAFVAVLVGGIVSGGLTGVLLASHASVLGLVLGFVVGLVLTALILSSGQVDGGGKQRALRYSRPPTAPHGWPGTD